MHSTWESIPGVVTGMVVKAIHDAISINGTQHNALCLSISVGSMEADLPP